NGYIDVRTPSLTTGLLFRVDNANGGTERMRIEADGKIGIGTSTPNTLLHVHNGIIMVSGANGAGGPMILFSDNPASTAWPNGRWGIEYDPTQHGLNFWKPWNNPGGGGSGNYYMFLKDDGKIGMGVDPSSCSNAFPTGYRLYVKDGILTEKIKVGIACSSNWSDYVFDDNYKLQPLR